MLGWNEEIKKELGACGQNVYIGHNVMFARPKEVFLGDNVRIDPFSFIACGLVADGYNQFGTHTIMNGRKTVRLGKWVGFGYRITVLTGSEDFTGEFGPVNDWFGHGPSTEADVIFEDYCSALSSSIIMPGVIVPEGAVIAANSVVRVQDELLPYWMHGHSGWVTCGRVSRGVRPFKRRNEENIKKFAQEWENAS